MTGTLSEYHVSPSQLVSYIHGCARAWAFAYIWGLKSEGNRFSDLGHKVHKVGEDWINLGKVPDFLEKPARIFKPALSVVPPPNTLGLFAEELVLWDSPRGNKFKFLRDLYLPYWEPGVAYIWDYKSTSNLSYAHTKEELEETDPQGVTYAAQLFLDDESPFEPLHTVKENWIYLPTNPPHKAHQVLAEHKRDTCLARFDLLDQTASVMLRHRQLKTHPLAFEPKTHHCQAFGGCPYKGRECNLSIQEEIMSMTEQATGNYVSGFLASVRRNNDAATAGPTPGAQAPMIVSAATPAPATAPPAVPMSQPNQVLPTLPAFLQSALAAAVPAPQPITPTAAAPQPAQLPWLQNVAPAPAPAPVIPDLPVPQSAVVVLPSTLVETTPFQAAIQAPAQADPPKKKRHRRTKAEMEADRKLLGAGWGEGLEQRSQEEQVANLGEGVVDAEFEEVDESTNRVHPDSGSTICLGGPGLLERIVVAMASNPGYCALSSVELVDKAKAIAAAVEVEG